MRRQTYGHDIMEYAWHSVGKCHAQRSTTVECAETNDPPCLYRMTRQTKSIGTGGTHGFDVELMETF